MKYNLLFITLLVYGMGWGQVIIFSEDFSSITSGNNTSTSGSSTAWSGNNNFPTVATVYQAGGSAKLGSSTAIGSIISKPLDLSVNGGNFTLSFDVKGWTTVEGNIRITITGQTSQIITYTAVIASSNFESKTLNFTGGVSNSTIKIETTAKRAFLDNIVVSYIASTPTTYTTSWSNGTGPTVSLDAIIDGDLTISGDLTCKDLTINSGKTLTVAAGTTLKVSGNLVNNGSIVFKSNNTSTGRFDSYSGNPITGTGTVTMERFIDGKRAYRLLAPGVTTSGTIANNWQQQVYITGSTTGANGFDATTTGNPSMFTYGDAGWASIGNTNVLTLDAEKGYRILIRGDRTPSILTSPSNGNMNTSVTLSATGTMKTGNVVYNTLSSQDYTLVANPYISPINWATVTKSGISDTYYVWDPNLGTGNQRGRYVSCDIAGTTSIISGSGSPSTDVDQYIQPGQAFFIQKITSGVNGSITVKETDKATTFTDVFRTTNASANNTSIDGKLGINLYESLAYSLGEYPIDGAVAVNGAGYNTYSSADDINKIMSHGEQVAFVRENMQLGVEKVSAPQATDELSIASINLLANKSYTWSVVLQDNFSSEDAYLYDAFTQSYHPLNASNTTVVPFETTTDVASINSNRFKIVFQNTALTSPIFDNLIGLYPNPSNGANGFYITNVTANAKVELFTLLGQSVSVTTALNGTIVQVKPISEVAKGIYVVQVTSEDGLTKQVKWIVE